ncbi:MAG: formate dehydrogenase subunit gamma, partial [Deltaproteobacteria bacterium]
MSWVLGAWPVLAAESNAENAKAYNQFMTEIGGSADWGQWGKMFTILQGNEYFMIGFLLLITVVPIVFALHLLIVGAKHFDHGGKQILFFPLFARIVHFIGAASFTILVLSGLLIVSGQFFGGGGLIRFARYAHIAGAVCALPAVIFMLIIWFKDMLPAACDIKWILILGGYLSKKKVPVPAKKFNAGQKMWFWCAIPGGLIMM